MTRNYKYIILIKFLDKEGGLIKRINANYQYSNNNSFTDEIEVSDGCIKVTAFRTRKYLIEEIIVNSELTINRQVMKSLVYYYSATGAANTIKDIRITRYLNDTIQDESQVDKESIKQVASNNITSSYIKSINQDKLDVIFEETEKGRFLLNTLTHVISSYEYLNHTPFMRFELLWKGFNSIYKAKEKNNGDFECHISLRRDMISNKKDYSLSCGFVDGFTKEDISKIIHYKKMILNDYNRIEKMSAFCEFIERIGDNRLIQIIEDNLSINEDFLNQSGLKNKVYTYINSKKKSGLKFNVEVVAFICIKYLYFVRNKLIHAERAYHDFFMDK